MRASDARAAFALAPADAHAPSVYQDARDGARRQRCPRSRLFPTDDLVSLIADAPRESCHASCTGEIMAHLDDVTRQQTNLLLFVAWLHFVLVLALMRD